MTPGAEAVRDAYLLYRRMIHPQYVDSERWRPCWEKAAAFIESNQFQLQPFMEAQFHFVRPFPMPNGLYSETAAKHYKCFYSNTDNVVYGEISATIEDEFNYFETRIKLFSAEDVLCSAVAPFGPIFRFLAAKLLKRDDLAKVFEADAKDQAARHPTLAAAYKQVFESEGIEWL